MTNNINKKIAFLTAKFPFEGGEQFIENEIPYWEDDNTTLIIFPMVCEGEVRYYPENVQIDTCLGRAFGVSSKLKGVLYGLSSNFFWREIKYLIRVKKINCTNIISALKTVSASFLLSKILERKQKEYGFDVMYSYWNDTQAYASCLLKREGKVKRVFSRFHGYDIYENRNKNSYMPFKRQVISDIDQCFVISNSAKVYLNKQYSADNSQISLARLGVALPAIISSVSPHNSLNILSLSYCIELKRIDKIIDAIYLYSRSFNSISICWTHIGPGPLMSKLQEHALKKFRNTNITFEFTGELSHKSVESFFEKNEIDLFINASDSEGVPVSIMEAMSYGVPVIAPDIGGISELLDPDSCFLMNEYPSAQDISEAIESLSVKCKKTSARNKCKIKIANDFNSNINFKKFVETLKDYD